LSPSSPAAAANAGIRRGDILKAYYDKQSRIVDLIMFKFHSLLFPPLKPSSLPPRLPPPPPAPNFLLLISHPLPPPPPSLHRSLSPSPPHSLPP
jgi:hypothetical protein